MSDYYSILGVKEFSTIDEVKKAYRKMAMQYHPDKNQGDKSAEEKFKQIAEAYETLGTESKKKLYDAAKRRTNSRPNVEGFDDFVKNEFGYGRDRGFRTNPFNYSKQDRQNANDRARASRNKTHAPPPTTEHLDLIVPAELDLIKSFSGEKLTISVSRRVIEYIGKTAEGKLKWQYSNENKEVSITINTTKNYLQFKKIDSGYSSKIRLQKLGNEEMHVGSDLWGESFHVPLTGDLFVELRLTVPNNIEILDGQIIQLVDLPLYKILSEEEKIEIETITGKKYEAKINHPESTNNLKFVLPKGGIIGQSGELGDYTIKFNVLTPKVSKLNKKEKDTLISLLKNI